MLFFRYDFSRYLFLNHMAIGIVEGTIEPGSEQFNILVLSASVLNYYYYFNSARTSCFKIYYYIYFV